MWKSCGQVLTKWIRGYVVTEYPRIHLSFEVALKRQGISQNGGRNKVCLMHARKGSKICESEWTH